MRAEHRTQQVLVAANGGEQDAFIGALASSVSRPRGFADGSAMLDAARRLSTRRITS